MQALLAYMWERLGMLGLTHHEPDGAYYVMADTPGLGFVSDVEFARWLVREVGVTVVLRSSFYTDPALGRQHVQFAFPKRIETLAPARELLSAGGRPRFAP